MVNIRKYVKQAQQKWHPYAINFGSHQPLKLARYSIFEFLCGILFYLVSELIRVRISGITGFLMILAADNSVVPSISKE